MLLKFRLPMKQRKHPIAVLDIGTSKIACFVAQPEEGGTIRITGIGHQLSKGVRGGFITDVSEAETSILAAVHAAEQMAGDTIEDVTVGLSGASITSRNVTVEMALSGEVTEQDLADIMAEGQESVLGPGTEILHSFPVSYTLDAARGIADPLEMIGEKLGAELHIITASSTVLKNLSHCVARCHLNMKECVASIEAAALAVLEEDEKDLGVTLIDMGGGVTSFAIFQGGHNIYVDQVPIGGLHVTGDIAKGLSTSMAHAERLKTLHGSAMPTAKDEQVMIDVPQLGEEASEEEEANLMPRSMLVGVIRPRMEELFEMVRSKIEASGMDKIAGRRIVLTGGASQLLGVRELASRMLGKQVRLGKPDANIPGLASAVSGPAFSAAIGMLLHTADQERQKNLPSAYRSSSGFSGRFGAVKNWLKENF